MNEGGQLIPLKPLCQILELSYKNQDRKIREDPYFSQVYQPARIVAADGKERQMNCLPLIEVENWLHATSNTNRTEEQKQKKVDFLSWLRSQRISMFRAVNETSQQNTKEAGIYAQLQRNRSRINELRRENTKLQKELEHMRLERYGLHESTKLLSVG